MVPPPLAARTRGEQSDHKCFKASLLLPNIRLFDAAPPRTSVCRLQHVHELRVPNRCFVGEHLIPLIRSALNMSATPGNLDTEQPLSYCYELPTQLRLESVANAHTAADLHVRSWVSYRAGQESLGRRERVTNTPSAISDNP